MATASPCTPSSASSFSNRSHHQLFLAHFPTLQRGPKRTVNLFICVHSFLPAAQSRNRPVFHGWPHLPLRQNPAGCRPNRITDSGSMPCSAYPPLQKSYQCYYPTFWYGSSSICRRALPPQKKPRLARCPNRAQGGRGLRFHPCAALFSQGAPPCGQTHSQPHAGGSSFGITAMPFPSGPSPFSWGGVSFQQVRSLFSVSPSHQGKVFARDAFCKLIRSLSWAKRPPLPSSYAPAETQVSNSPFTLRWNRRRSASSAPTCNIEDFIHRPADGQVYPDAPPPA